MAKVKAKKGLASLASLLPEVVEVAEVIEVSEKVFEEPSLEDKKSAAIAKAKELYAVPDTATVSVRVCGGWVLEVSISIKESITPTPQTFAEWEATKWVEQTRYITVKFMPDGNVREHWENVHINKTYRPFLKKKQLPLFFPEYFFLEDGEVFTEFRGVKCLASEPSTPTRRPCWNREEFLGFSEIPSIRVFLRSVAVDEYGRYEVNRYCDIDLVGYSTESVRGIGDGGDSTSRDSDGFWNK